MERTRPYVRRTKIWDVPMFGPDWPDSLSKDKRMFQWGNYRPVDPESTLWDVVIIGAGMGGSVLGWSLARQNLSVLYLERGDPVSPLREVQESGQQRRQSFGLRRLFRPQRASDDHPAR